MESGSGAAEDEAGDVVGLAGGADEVLDAFHEELKCLLGVEIREATDDVEPAIVGEFFAGSVEGLDDAVSEEDKRVTGLQRHFGGGESSFGSNAKWERGGFEALCRRVCAADDRGIVAGVDVGEAAGRGIVFSEDGGGEALAAEAMGASVVIEADGEFAEGQIFGGDGAQAGLQGGHKERGGNAFAGDVGHDEHELAAGGRIARGIEGVVIVAGDGILRTGVERDFRIRNRRRSGGNEPSLDFAGDFEIAFHGDLVGEFKREKKQKEKSGEKLVLEFDAIVVGDLETESGEGEQAKGNEQKHATGRRELVHHGPKELLGNGPGAFPTGEFVYLVPIDILAIEAVAGAGVGGELGPQVVDAPAFADALPKVAEARSGSGRWFGSRIWWWSSSAHEQIICDWEVLSESFVEVRGFLLPLISTGSKSEKWILGRD